MHGSVGPALLVPNEGYPQGRTREHELGPERLQHHPALEGHRGRHGEREVVATGSSHKGEADPGVA